MVFHSGIIMEQYKPYIIDYRTLIRSIGNGCTTECLTVKMFKY